MKNKFLLIPGAVAMTGLGMGLSSCSMQDNPEYLNQNAIIASVTSPTQTRTAVDGEPADGVVGLVWTDGDQLGVFDTNAKAQVLYNKQGSGNEAKGIFVPSGQANAPVYAYYPYSADNDSKAATALSGEIPAVQVMDSGNIPGDYKYGAVVSGNGTDGYEFVFQHLFSLIRVDVSAEGTILSEDKVKEITFSAKRGESPVNIAGSFTFDATNGGWTEGKGVNSVKLTWDSETPSTNRLTLGEKETVYSSVFPNVKAGDNLSFTVKTVGGYTVTFDAPSKVSFEKEHLYLFPLNLAAIAERYKDSLVVKDNNDKDVTSDFLAAETPDPEAKHGTFTCASYNVDGLPEKISFYTINGDGPLSDGTTLLGQTVNEKYKWDFFGVSEDFAFDSELTTALSKYSHGTWRGTVSAAQLSSKADTDGMNFFWKKEGVTATKETFIEFNDSYGGLVGVLEGSGGGANTCIKKGFRYYLVTLADGTEIDVYITHMNTYSSTNEQKYLDAVHSQTQQVVDYIKDHKNGRPIIFMGDTNMRYTRHKIKELLIDGINEDKDLTIVDPWVDLVWKNDFSSVGGTTYPAYPGNSLMVSDATGTSSTDIIISEADGGLQKGEVVDKVFYINVEGAKTQIKAVRYLRDTSYKKADGTPLADHYPIVVEFEY